MTSTTTEFLLSEPLGWFFDMQEQFTDTVNTSELLFKYRGDLQPVLLLKSLRTSLATYPNLSSRFIASNGSISQQWVARDDDSVFSYQDLSALAEHDIKPAIQQTCTDVRRSFNVASGNLSRLMLFKTAEQEGYLLLCHHFINADLLTMRSLLIDIMDNYQALANQQGVSPKKVDDFNQWLAQYFQFRETIYNDAFLRYWNAIPWQDVQLPKSDYPERFTSPQDVWSALKQRADDDFIMTELVIDSDISSACLARYGRQMPTASCALIAHAIGAVFKLPRLMLSNYLSVFNLEKFSPLAPKKTRSVLGRLTATTVLALDTHFEANSSNAIEAICHAIKQTPYEGLGFYDLRHSQDPKTLANFRHALETHCVEYNYWGKMPSINQAGINLQFQRDYFTGYDTYGIKHQKGLTDKLLRLRLYIIDGQLHFEIVYFKPYFNPSTIERLKSKITQLAAC